MPRLEAAAPLLWWRPKAATFVVAMNRVDVVDLVVDLVDVDLDVGLVDVDLDVDLFDIDLDVVPFVDVALRADSIFVPNFVKFLKLSFDVLSGLYRPESGGFLRTVSNNSFRED